MSADQIHINPGQLSDCLALRANSALESCTDVDSDAAGIFIARRWSSLSSGEELLWRVLGWLNGKGDVPSDADLRAGLDDRNYDAARAAVSVGSGVAW